MPIFLSYRRGNTDHVVGRIYDQLRRRFPDDEVFLDIDQVPIGVDFHQHLRDWVDRSDVMLAVIGDDWRPERLHSEDDFVRIELVAALNKGIPVVPVFVNGVSAVPSLATLPSDVQPLSKRQGIAVGGGADFRIQMEQLTRWIMHHLPHPDPAAPSKARTSGGTGADDTEAARLKAELAKVTAQLAAFEKRLTGGDPAIPANGQEATHAAPVVLRYEIGKGDAGASIELPFVIGVLANLSGQVGEPLPPIAKRDFVRLDSKNFDDRFRAIKPRAWFKVPNTMTGDGELAVDLNFESVADFTPAGIALQLSPTRKLLEVRQSLFEFSARVDDNDELEMLMARLLDEPALLQALATGSDPEPFPYPALQPDQEGPGVDEFLQIFARLARLQGDAGIEHARRLVMTFAQGALQGNAPDYNQARKGIDEMIARIDHTISGQVNEILHHPRFQALERTWLGLRHLVNHVGTGVTVRALNVTKKALAAALASTSRKGWSDHPLAGKIVEEPYGVPGGEPFACLIADMAFDQSPADCHLLSALAQICAQAQTPIVTGVAPHVFNADSWAQLSERRDLTTLLSLPQYAAWNALRDAEYSRYVGLAMPGFLVREPYSDEGMSFDGFCFAEDVDAEDHDKFCWSSSAYLYATVLARAFSAYRWPGRTVGAEGGGHVDDLPLHRFAEKDCGTGTVCPAEVMLSAAQQSQLLSSGVLPLVHRKGSNTAVFVSGQSFHRVAGGSSVETRNDRYAQLPALLAACRFSQYLRCIARDKAQAFQNSVELRDHLRTWIGRYVHAADAKASAERPLRFAGIDVEPAAADADHYRAEFCLTPAFQLKTADRPFRVSVNLPRPGGT